MSTITAFQEMTGIREAKALEIRPDEQEDIVGSLRAQYASARSTTSLTVTALKVSSWAWDRKDPEYGSKLVPVKIQPPARVCHWGVIIGDIDQDTAFLYYLVIKEDGKGNLFIEFNSRGVLKADRDVTDGMKEVANTTLSHGHRQSVGRAMINAFGNYHRIFWNCQTFAKCFIRVLTNNTATFEHLTLMTPPAFSYVPLWSIYPLLRAVNEPVIRRSWKKSV